MMIVMTFESIFYQRFPFVYMLRMLTMLEKEILTWREPGYIGEYYRSLIFNERPRNYRSIVASFNFAR